MCNVTFGFKHIYNMLTTYFFIIKPTSVLKWGSLLLEDIIYEQPKRCLHLFNSTLVKYRISNYFNAAQHAQAWPPDTKKTFVFQTIIMS